jgi:hypothetical protein
LLCDMFDLFVHLGMRQCYVYPTLWSCGEWLQVYVAWGVSLGHVPSMIIWSYCSRRVAILWSSKTRFARLFARAPVFFWLFNTTCFKLQQSLNNRRMNTPNMIFGMFLYFHHIVLSFP